jgi:hypothetical protein
MPPDAGPARIPPAPADFDGLVEWFDATSHALVLLEEYRIEELRGMSDRVGRVVREHGERWDGRLGTRPEDAGRAADWGMLRSDHAWFIVSIEQLGWFLAIVEHEDHGGHRQALGQYGRVFAEALRRHRARERSYFGAPG